MVGMMLGEEVLEVDLEVVIEGLDMIMVVDTSVRWEGGQGMVKKGLMADTWVVEVDIKVVLQIGNRGVVVMVMLPTLCLLKERA